MTEHDVPCVNHFGRVGQLGQAIKEDDGLQEQKLVARDSQVAKTVHEITVEKMKDIWPMREKRCTRSLWEREKIRAQVAKIVHKITVGKKKDIWPIREKRRQDHCGKKKRYMARSQKWCTRSLWKREKIYDRVAKTLHEITVGKRKDTWPSRENGAQDHCGKEKRYMAKSKFADNRASSQKLAVLANFEALTTII